MNKNKIFFTILGIIVLLLLIFLVGNLNKGASKGIKKTNSGDIRIWILYDNSSKFTQYIQLFKEAYPQYASKNFIVESFSDEITYFNTLVSSITSGDAPDIFVMNNSETSPLENQIMGIDPSRISPNDFRLRFLPVFGEDLIMYNEEDDTIEFLKGIPVGYETLGIFYNRKYFLKPSGLDTWSGFLKEVKKIGDKYGTIVPVALGNGSGVRRSSDIIQSFFSLEGVTGLNEISTGDIKQVLANYKSFYQEDGDNRYSAVSVPFISETDIDFFTNGDVASILGYPRDLFNIDSIGYQKSFLFAAPFPKYSGKEKKASIKYNYFVINKDTKHGDMANDFLSYIFSVEGQQSYIDTYPYYLSPEISVFSEMQEKKILSKYNIVYKNFIEEGTELVSFDVGNKIIFDTKIPAILDMSSGYDQEFSNVKSFIICSSTKQKTLLNLSSPCK